MSFTASSLPPLSVGCATRSKRSGTTARNIMSPSTGRRYAASPMIGAWKGEMCVLLSLRCKLEARIERERERVREPRGRGSKRCGGARAKRVHAWDGHGARPGTMFGFLFDRSFGLRLPSGRWIPGRGSLFADANDQRGKTGGMTRLTPPFASSAVAAEKIRFCCRATSECNGVFG
jgi:hypothetical protein